MKEARHFSVARKKPMKTEFPGLHAGLEGVAEITVENQHTAQHVGSGHQKILATPVMITLIEDAAQNAIDSLLPDSCQTIGTGIHVRHLAATPEGMRVIARVRLTAVDGRNLTFQATVSDEKEMIGDGVHERAIISVPVFTRLLARKRNK